MGHLPFQPFIWAIVNGDRYATCPPPFGSQAATRGKQGNMMHLPRQKINDFFVLIHR